MGTDRIADWQAARDDAAVMQASARLRSVGWVTVLLVIGSMTLVRFVGLEKAPPGFYNDEAYVAAHVICLSRTGHDAGGQDRPLFSGSGGGGYASPTHLYPVALWIRIFGPSIGAFRAYAALTMSVAIVGLFFLAKLLLGGRGATYVALSASLSPWMFQFSRMAVDDPATFLLGMAWGTYFYLRSSRIVDAVAAALFLSVAAYAYPAGRVVLPILLLPLLSLKLTTTRVNRRYLITFMVTGIAFCLPLLDQIVSGTLMSRFAVVGIFSEHYRRVHGLSGTGAWALFLRNFLRHLGPGYLLVHGDANLRHSTQFCGELSWLDVAALASGAICLLWQLLLKQRMIWSPLVGFCIAAFFIGIVPAALTWEGVPHSLRSVASWPFACMLTGYVIWKFERRWPATLLLFAIIAVLFAIGFTRDYFLAYPRRAGEAFQLSVKRGAERARRTGDWAPFRAVVNAESYDERAAEYFLMVYGEQSCDEQRANRQR